MFNRYCRIDFKLCMRAQRQCIAAFCYAVLHHIPVTIWEPNHD